MMSMRAEGGTSLYGNGDIPNFSLLTSAITEAGVGDFSATALRKALAGKSIRLTPSISSEGQRIAGSSSVKDMETITGQKAILTKAKKSVANKSS